jgi:cytochrome c-type biogenesis protein CcmH/NrfF
VIVTLLPGSGRVATCLVGALLAVALLSISWPAVARAGGPPDASAAEHEARRIEAMLIAPCCWREQVSVHQSEAAEQVKQEVRAMLAAGLTRQQVLDRFVSSYGPRILAEPPNAGFGRVLHQAPWVAGLSSLVGLALVIRHVTKRRPDRQETAGGSLSASVPQDGEPAEGDVRYGHQLDDELRNLD